MLAIPQTGGNLIKKTYALDANVLMQAPYALSSFDDNEVVLPLVVLEERTNGLSFAAEHMKGGPLCFQIAVDKSECERSELAMDTTSRL